MHKRNAVVELKAADGLIVELENTLPKLFPERKPFPRELYNPRTFVFRIRHALDQSIALKALQDTIQILAADDEKISKGAD